MRYTSWALIFVLFLGCSFLHAGVLTYGTEDCLTTGCYGANDPTSGATLLGLSANAITDSSNSFGHGYPFSPTAGDFAGTDQIYVGSVQTGSDDGYSVAPQRINGPDVMTLNYSPLVGSGQTVTSLTLGIAADDFQFPLFGNPFTATVNGSVDVALSNELNSLNESGPMVHFFTIGLDPSLDTASHTITLSIDEGGNGGDGYAIDFLTMGVTTAATGTPEPASLMSLAGGLVGLGLLRRRRAR
jgi:hypothetical protein